MIGSVRGTLLAKDASSAVIEAGGIGFTLGMSTRGVASLPGVGEEAFAWTVLSVRDDALSLYGFGSEQERALFNRLVAVSGIGPKVALAALSSFSPDNLASAIASGDISLVATIPGVGKKTAQRMVLELKGSLDGLTKPEGLFADAEAADSSEAADALLAMGFSSAEVQLALQGYDGAADDTAAMVKHALRKLGTKL